MRPRLRQTNGTDFRGLDLDALEDEDKEGDEDGEKRVVRSIDYSDLLSRFLSWFPANAGRNDGREPR